MRTRTVVAAAMAALSTVTTKGEFNVPAGFEVRLFAAAPAIVAPVAMIWDERGRLWVLERSPTDRPRSPKGTSRIQILEDTNGDGSSDSTKTFAKGLSAADGLALGGGGVYVSAGTNLLFLEDTDRDGRADRTTVSMTAPGAGSRLTDLAWGPDGYLYMNQKSSRDVPVRDRGKHSEAPTETTASVVRYHPQTKKREVFADRIPFGAGLDWNASGDAFVRGQGNNHLYHVIPGGHYSAGHGPWSHPFAYLDNLTPPALPSVVDWSHDDGGGTAFCIYQGNQFPAQWHGIAFVGGAHGINCDRLTPSGSSYRGAKEAPLLTSHETGFVPTSLQVGPDGALWIADSAAGFNHDTSPRSSRARKKQKPGRIWRLVWTGNETGKSIPPRPDPTMDLSTQTKKQLVSLLEHENIWQRRVAQRHIVEHRDPSAIPKTHSDPTVSSLLHTNHTSQVRLAALWTLHSTGLMEDFSMDGLRKDADPAIRMWVARLIGERGYPFGDAMRRLARLAMDTNAAVRLAAAGAARQFVSSTLTVNTPPAIPLLEVVTGGILSDLHKSPIDPADPVLPFAYWLALEPLVVQDAGHALGFYENSKDVHARDWPMSNFILTRIMRRVCDFEHAPSRAKHLNTAMDILERVAGQTNLANAALDGLLAGFAKPGPAPTIDLKPIFEKLTANPAVAEKTRRLWLIFQREESNYPINPAHSDFKKIKVGRSEPLAFDPRLLQ